MSCQSIVSDRKASLLDVNTTHSVNHGYFFQITQVTDGKNIIAMNSVTQGHDLCVSIYQKPAFKKLSGGPQPEKKVFSFQLKINEAPDNKKLASMKKLLEMLNHIIIDYFHGRLSGAVEQALLLKVDRSELSCLNQQLQNTTIVSALSLYDSHLQQVEFSAKKMSVGDSGLSEVSPFIVLEMLLNDIEMIRSEAQNFSETKNLVSDIVFNLTLQFSDRVSVKVIGINQVLKLLVKKFGL